MPEDVMTGPRPHADTMRGAIAYVSLDGRAKQAAAFYERAFGARPMGEFVDQENPERMMHVQVEINGGALMMTDCRAPWEEVAPPRGFNLMLVVGDGDAWWSRAVEAGCEVVMPFERMFWGDRWGMLRDPFGIEWAIDEPATVEGQ
jgi:PhnB protein